MQSGGNHKLKTIPRNVSGARLKHDKTLVQYCNHANNVRTVDGPSTHASDLTWRKSPRLPIPAHPLSAKGGNREGYNSDTGLYYILTVNRVMNIIMKLLTAVWKILH